MTNTPGFDFRITIKLSTTKKGQPRATYWSFRTMRWLPLPRIDAELFLAMEQADAYKAWTPDEVAA